MTGRSAFMIALHPGRCRNYQVGLERGASAGEDQNDPEELRLVYRGKLNTPRRRKRCVKLRASKKCSRRALHERANAGSVVRLCLTTTIKPRGGVPCATPLN